MKEKETWLSGYDSHIEPPPKIGRRKQMSARKLELRRWRAFYPDYAETLWLKFPEEVVGVAIGASFLLTLFICLDNVCKLEWMYAYLRVTLCLSLSVVAGLAVYLFLYACVYIRALFRYPYPLPKFTFKQTFKFGNQNGSK